MKKALLPTNNFCPHHRQIIYSLNQPQCICKFDLFDERNQFHFSIVEKVILISHSKMRKPRIVTVSHRRQALDDPVSSSVVYLAIFLEFSTSIHPSTPDNRIVLFMWSWDQWDRCLQRTTIHIRLDFLITTSL